jgi:hypothetical protein
LTVGIDNGGEGKPERKASSAGRKPKTQRRERNPLERRRDAREIGRIRLRFALWTLEEIADHINAKYYSGADEEARCKEAAAKAGVESVEPPQLSKQMVSTVLKRLDARLEEEAVDELLALRRRQIAELRELEEYCRERYEATIGKHTKTRETTGDKASTTTEEEELSGERGYLELAFKCKQEIVDLTGSRPPRKIAPTNPEGTKPFDAFGESEELKRLAALFKDIAGHKP